jgi:predicted transcriptional regulator
LPKHLAGITLFSLDEISKELNLSVATLRRYIHTKKEEKKLIAKKMGNSFYVTENNLKNFLESKCNG